jgi:hypothetical protein
MGVSSLGMFEVVRLGPHEEILRDAIFRSDPLDPHQYPFFLTAVTINGKFNFDLIVPPNLARMDGHHHYRTVIGGIVYSFIVGSHRVEPSLQEMVLSREGAFKISIETIENIPYLLDQMLQITEAVQNAEQGKSPEP